MLNLHLRLSCTRTFFMPHKIFKDRDVVLLRIFEKLDHVSTFGWQSETCLEMLLGPLLGRSLKNSPGTVDYTSNNKLQPIRELSELCAQKGYLKKKSVSSWDRDSTFVDIQIVWDSTRWVQLQLEFLKINPSSHYIKGIIFLREGSQKFHKFTDHLKIDQDVGGIFVTTNT